MATSGYVETNSYSGAYLRLEWQRTSYDSTLGVNYTHWVLKGVKSTSGYYYARKFKVTSYNFVTGNTTELYSSSSDIQLYNGTVIAEGDEYFTTNSDGTCRIQFNIEGAIYSYEVNCTGYDAWNLDTIPRKSELTVGYGTINGANPAFTINRKSNDFRDTIKYITPGTTTEVTIVEKTALNSYDNWSPPSSLYQYFSNSDKIEITYKIYTYNGNTLVGSNTTTGYIYANVTDCKPTISVTATPTNYSSLTGSATTIIKGVSNVTISATATAKNSATIKSIVTNGTTIATNATSGSKTINKVTTGTFKTTVTDSRGFTNSPLDTKTFEFVNYVPVSITANAYRVNATSSTVKAVVSGNFFNAKFGTNGVTNTLTLTWKYKLKSASSYTTGGTLTATKTGTTYKTAEVTLGTNFSYENDYDFLFTAVDKVNTSGVTALAPVKKGTPIFDYGVDSSGINYFNVNGYIYGSSATTGQEIPTNEFIDRKQVYRKRINLGTLPNTTTKNVSSGLNPAKITLVRMQGAAKSTDNTMLCLPFVSASSLIYAIEISLSSNGDIQIITGADRRAYSGYVDLYYTKN